MLRRFVNILNRFPAKSIVSRNHTDGHMTAQATNLLTESFGITYAFFNKVILFNTSLTFGCTDLRKLYMNLIDWIACTLICKS